MRIALLSGCEVKAGLFSCVLPLLVIWSRQLLTTYKILKFKHLIYAFYIYIIQLQKASLKLKKDARVLVWVVATLNVIEYLCVLGFTCALQKEILYQGKLFLSENWICFHSKVFGKDTKVCKIIMYEIVMLFLRNLVITRNSIYYVRLENTDWIHGLFRI